MQVLQLGPKILIGKGKYGCRYIARSPKIQVGKGKYKSGYYKFKWRINPKCNTHTS